MHHMLNFYFYPYHCLALNYEMLAMPMMYMCTQWYYSLAATVSFNQSTYNVDEYAGPAQPVLVLSNPSSTDITVRITDNQNTASSK